MTIALGMLIKDGIIIAADTQETTSITKAECEKIVVLRSEREEAPGIVAFTGAGSGGYLDKLGQAMLGAFLNPGKKTDTTRDLEVALHSFFGNHVIPFGKAWADDDDLAVQSIIGYERNGTRKLLANINTALREAGPFVVVGTGATTARPILRELHQPDLLREAAIRLAAYAVYQAKQQDPYSGKKTEMIVLEDGRWAAIDSKTIETWEVLFAERVQKSITAFKKQLLGLPTTEVDRQIEGEMGEKKLLVLAAEFSSLRLKCAHCGGARVFQVGVHPGRDVRCDCGQPMKDADHLVESFNRFHQDLARFGWGREATFEIALQDWNALEARWKERHGG